MPGDSAESYVAIDLGATSGRVVLGHFNGRTIRLEEAHRFTNGVVRRKEGCFWDWPRLLCEVRGGLGKAAAAKAAVVCVGCDSWGHDHGFLNDAGQLLAWPYSYQDERTADMPAVIEEHVGRLDLYQRTAGFPVPISALHQLLATARYRPELLARAAHLLFIPGLINHDLCGAVATEPCMASLTQLFDGRLSWDSALMETLGIPARIFPPVRPTGEVIGAFRPDEGAATPWEVRLVAAHDTASAFAAAPLQAPGDMVLSLGTWAMLGVESPDPVTSEQALRDGVGSIRIPGGRWGVMRGMLGLYHLERFIREEGGAGTAAEWAERASREAPSRALLDFDHFVVREQETFREALGRTLAVEGQDAPETPAAIARCIYESLAQSVARAAESLAVHLGRPLGQIHLVGGGAKCALFAQLLADATRTEVVTSVVEATAVGNALVQAWGRKRIDSLADLREVVRASWPPRVTEPAP